MTRNKESLRLKDTVVEAIKERKGKRIVVLDLTDLEQSIADYFVICHGTSNVQVDSISDFVDRYTKTELKVSPIHKEGTDVSQWVLVDYGDVVVHVFQEEHRDFYKLEELWADAKIERFEDE